MKVLYVSYNSALSPLVASQVIPYLTGLAASGLHVTLLTFDPPADRPSAGERAQLITTLEASAVRWRSLRYHKRPPIISTLWDLFVGSLHALAVARVWRFDVVHARSYVPGVIGLLCKRFLGTRFVFDMRGMMADEYAEGGVWRNDGAGYRMVKAMERIMLREADAVVVLTERIRRYLLDQPELGLTQSRAWVVPCCVELQRFACARDGGLARKLGLNSKLVLVYAGSLGTWQLLDEMLDFVACGLRRRPDVHLLLLNRDEQALVRSRLERRPELRRAVTVVAADPADVPRYLASADAGLSFRKASFSQWASSPIKVAEYLACGLPVVATRGTGDLDEWLEDYRAGVLVLECRSEAYARAWNELLTLLDDPGVKRRCHRLAHDRFDVQHGVRAYQAIYAGLIEADGTRGVDARLPST